MAHTNQSKEAIKNLGKTFKSVDRLVSDLDQLSEVEINELIGKANSIKHSLNCLLRYKRESK